MAVTYRNVEHEHVVEDELDREDGNDNDLRQLEPRYSELGQAEEKGEIKEDPFQEQPPRGVAILDYLQPVVEFPGPEQDIDGEGVEALLGGVEEGEGDQGLAGGTCREVLGGER